MSQPALFPDHAIYEEIMAEVDRAKKKHPRWPDHIVARAGIVCEEAGELVRACLNLKYKSNDKGRNKEYIRAEIRKEAIQTAATAIRFLENLK